MDVPAEKVAWLFALEKLAHRRAAGMTQIRDAVEHRSIWRRMADCDHWLQAIECVQALAKLFFGIFAGCIERSGVRIAEPDHMKAADLDPATMEIIESETTRDVCDLQRRLVIAGNQIDAFGALPEYLAHRIETARKVNQITRAEVI